MVMLVLAANSNEAAANRPNIVFIMADDHAWHAVSAYGESRHLIQTPNIDRLANEGVRFLTRANRQMKSKLIPCTV